MRGNAEIRDPLIGTTIGSYRVERLLGQGGMGAVYELLHPGIHKRLALKVLHEEYSQRPDVVARFFDEARAVNLVDHPNIVDIIDFSKLPDGRPYLTMEFLEGTALSDYLDAHGAMAEDEVRDVLAQMCAALGAAHAAGIVHRDLKPENIFFCERPGHPRVVKVLDFGIAKLHSDLRKAPMGATRTGVVMGTPLYMSPEQASGKSSEVDHRCDIYALGVITFQMLAGRTPFTGETFAELIVKHLNEAPPALTELRGELPPAWNDVVQRALAKTPGERFGSMAELAQATTRVGAVSPPAEPPRVAGERPWLLPVAIGLIAIATAGIVFMILRGGDEAAESPLVIAPAADATEAVAPPDAGVMAAVPVPDAAPAPAEVAAKREAAPEVETAAQRRAASKREARERKREASKREASERKREASKREASERKRETSTREDARGEGRLEVTASPWAFVHVDGKKVGQTPLSITLPAGSHRVVIENPEIGQRARRRVEIDDGKVESIDIDLR